MALLVSGASMKPQLKKALASDRTICFVADAIRYLDSPTDYQECLPVAPKRKAGRANAILLLDEQDVPILERLVAGLLFRLAIHSRLAMRIIRRMAGLR
jgi:hypothetical protein